MQKARKVKLQLVAKSQWGTKIILPSVGLTEVSEEGIIEIEDMVATVLLNQTESYKLVEGNGTTVTKEVHAEKVAEKEVKKESKPKQTAKDKPAEKKEEKKEEKESDGLDEMTLTELKDIAKESGFEYSEYKKFVKSKKLMINFLRKNA